MNTSSCINTSLFLFQVNKHLKRQIMVNENLRESQSNVNITHIFAL